MVERSLRASPEGRKTAKTALIGCRLTQQQLADALGVTRQPIGKFFKGKPVDRELFVRICEKLKLDWQAIAQKDDELEAEQNRNAASDIDALVQEIRKQVEPNIRERCGTMRVLDMSQPIGLGKIYTSVNILEKLTKTRGLELADLMRDTSPEEFDRFCLGNVRARRIPGLEAVEQFSKLMIFGKPGAGKTTFLKHLAIQCIGGKFQTERIPVFITLKDFAETDGNPDLLEYLDRSLLMHPALQNVVCAGRALILLDGLDEVRDADSDRVLRQITGFSQQFPQNQFVITCRIAAREYTFEKFTEVEIADFDDKQIADFSGKWFRSKNDPIKAERFLHKLQENEPIRELATNPLLLTLLCLVFEDSGSFPTNRAELYENGVDVLLKKWDVKRNIERDHVYKGLSLKRKKDLLSQIARTTFEEGNYFFKQRQLERYISEYIQNLSGASTDLEALEIDSAAVLKSIEAQHGLLVERARGIYSFSHLTFHEYFTARKIVMSCNPYAADDLTLQELVSHVGEKRWREVFLLTTQSLDPADALLRLMKAQIDRLLVGNERLQEFLIWVDEKARSVKVPFKLASVRAFYLALEQRLEIDSNQANVREFPIPTLAFSIDPDFAFAYDLGIDFELLKTLLASQIIEEATRSVNIKCLSFYDNDGNYYDDGGVYLGKEDTFILGDDDSDLNQYQAKVYGQFWDDVKEKWNVDSDISLHDELYIVFQYPLEEKLREELLFLREQLPTPLEFAKNPENEGEENWNDWGEFDCQSWTLSLLNTMLEHRNIGQDWQFSDTEEASVQQYYNANKLLVDCLNSDCYVSREVRQEIEDTLLLPMSE
ncbi:MAG: NACHT C-terminal helical domain 2-containing protein [Coleofasciculus sp.]|uniref:NACHT C-terminal helical domain 2-containing protein n=1 Tax=Coleofasciculus sp. TaxID=3100458 RepID=UPI003A220470